MPDERPGALWLHAPVHRDWAFDRVPAAFDPILSGDLHSGRVSPLFLALRTNGASHSAGARQYCPLVPAYGAGRTLSPLRCGRRDRAHRHEPDAGDPRRPQHLPVVFGGADPTTATATRENWRKECWRTPGVRWLKFNAVGGIGIVVQLVVLAVLKVTFHFDYLWATALAVETAVIHNFFLAPALHLVRQDSAGSRRDRRSSRAF